MCFLGSQRNGFVEVIKLSDKWIAEVKATAKSCPCILVGTKADLRDEREREGDPAKLKDVVTHEEMKQWASQYNFQGMVESSAKEKKGLNQVFLTAFKVVFQVRAVQSNPGTYRPKPGPGGDKPGSNKDRCCSI